MKFGVADFGIKVWDGGFYDVGTKLSMLKKVGFDGVERLEGSTEADVLTQALEFRKRGMEFTTCRGPSVSRGMAWTAALGKPYVWLELNDATRRDSIEVFCRRARKFTAAANGYGIDALLHNHLGTRIESQEEIETFLRACPDTKLLLDVGHVYGAGGNGAELIRRYPSRIASVHFKDVFIKDPSIGLDRWTERLRFCELGGGTPGVVDYRDCAAALKEIGYDGWVFVEHDTHLDEPEKELKISLDVLKEMFA